MEQFIEHLDKPFVEYNIWYIRLLFKVKWTTEQFSDIHMAKRYAPKIHAPQPEGEHY